MNNYSQAPKLCVQHAVSDVQHSHVISYRNIGILTAILDYLLILGSCLLASYGYTFVVLDETASFWPYFGIGNISAIVFVIQSYRLYKPTALLSLQAQVRGILLNWILLLFIVTLILFLLKIGASHSRGALSLFGVVGAAALLLSRLFICKALREALARGSIAGYPAIIIGDPQSLIGLSRLEMLQRFGAYEIGRFELPPDRQLELATLDQAIETARKHNVEWILLALRWDNGWLRKLVCERLQVLPLPVFLLPDENISSILAHPTRQIGPEFTVEIQRQPLSRPEMMAKRAVDIVLGTAILVALAPLLLLVSILIRVDSSGPVVFRQRRKGFNGREFTIYKFRTMSVTEDGDAIRQAERNDPRVTRVGRLLRATSIDELPQLANVVRGHMSLVGPRPHAVAHDNDYARLISKYAFRQHVKPGLTGWAQVNGFRGETARLEAMEQRVALDLWYIKNWSIWLDLKIIGLTFFEIMRRRNAY
jgi:undecaprenyl-phosphate galactose phosphotransferase/putative colanic acid biosynthesis UDP-glucose lipid carrier transferase